MVRTRDGIDYHNYIKARNRARKDCRDPMEQKVAAQAKENPKAFWSCVGGESKTRSGVADLKKDDDLKQSLLRRRQRSSIPSSRMCSLMREMMMHSHLLQL